MVERQALTSCPYGAVGGLLGTRLRGRAVVGQGGAGVQRSVFPTPTLGRRGRSSERGWCASSQPGKLQRGKSGCSPSARAVKSGPAGRRCTGRSGVGLSFIERQPGRDTHRQRLDRRDRRATRLDPDTNCTPRWQLRVGRRRTRTALELFARRLARPRSGNPQQGQDHSGSTHAGTAETGQPLRGRWTGSSTSASDFRAMTVMDVRLLARDGCTTDRVHWPLWVHVSIWPIRMAYWPGNISDIRRDTKASVHQLGLQASDGVCRECHARVRR